MDNIEILGKIIDLMRECGLDIESPYDVSNFFEDFGSHSHMFETGRFGYHCYQCGNDCDNSIRSEDSSLYYFCSEGCLDQYHKDMEAWCEEGE